MSPRLPLCYTAHGAIVPKQSSCGGPDPNPRTALLDRGARVQSHGGMARHGNPLEAANESRLRICAARSGAQRRAERRSLFLSRPWPSSEGSSSLPDNPHNSGAKGIWPTRD